MTDISTTVFRRSFYQGQIEAMVRSMHPGDELVIRLYDRAKEADGRIMTTTMIRQGDDEQ